MEWPNTDMLHFPEYMYWYEAIHENDVETIRDGFIRADRNLKRRLLNGKFDFTNKINQC